MSLNTIKYTLDNINSILFNGFEYHLPEETIENISNLALQVGSPDYVKTPVFKKRENITKIEQNCGLKKGKRLKATEVFNSEEWNTLKTFNPTKTEAKNGVDIQIDNIRTHLNKLTDKNYIDIRNKIIEIINNLIDENITYDDMARFSSTIFDIASTNRFYSKIYADLYSDISTTYESFKLTFEHNFNKFTGLFNNIECADPAINYDKFCEINKINEKRKALASFYLNLMCNGIIAKKQILSIIVNMLSQINSFISQDNKKNEVDELSEIISLLYKKELYNDEDMNGLLIEGCTISEIVEKIANSKVKDYKSLTTKTLFKFMDLIDM